MAWLYLHQYQRDGLLNGCRWLDGVYKILGDYKEGKTPIATTPDMQRHIDRDIDLLPPHHSATRFERKHPGWYKTTPQSPTGRNQQPKTGITGRQL